MSIAILLLNLLPGLLGAIPGLSAKVKQIIADVAGSGAAILASGAVTQPSVTTILAAWAGVITVLKSDPSLPASSLNAVAQLEKAVQAALTEDAVAAQAVDWTKIITISTV
jgi:hypothetical protein